MWGMYAANDAGCALGFDFTHLQNAYGVSIKCTYGEQEIDSIFKNFINLNRNGLSFTWDQITKKNKSGLTKTRNRFRMIWKIISSSQIVLEPRILLIRMSKKKR